jgi:hypothetical protein
MLYPSTVLTEKTPVSALLIDAHPINAMAQGKNIATAARPMLDLCGGGVAFCRVAE